MYALEAHTDGRTAEFPCGGFLQPYAGIHPMKDRAELGKKSWGGFWLWLAGYGGACQAVGWLPLPEVAVVRILLNLTAWALVLLGYIILCTERVYWYNGVSYAQASAAGSGRRKAFAQKHLHRFRQFALGFLLFTALSCLLGWSAWVDTTVFCCGLMAAAFSTVGFRL